VPFVPFVPLAPVVPFVPLAPAVPEAPVAPGVLEPVVLAPEFALPLRIASRTSALRSRRRIERSLMSPDLMSLMSRPVRLLFLTLEPVISVAAVAVVAPTAIAVATQAPTIFRLLRIDRLLLDGLPTPPGCGDGLNSVYP